ncbi:MAG: GHMP kinase [Actinobacteria bacterium]|nr:GHMP kinase [Actinomycetota bacterium]
MIISQTPLRVSFFGGGTDFPAYFRAHGGAVLSAAIDKYVFVIVKERFDDDIYLNYSRKEIVASVDAIQHELVREAMRATGVTRGVEITTLADVPSTGTGLGSSSSVLVGLLHALHAYRGRLVTSAQLAEDACRIEIEALGRPIGRQDQYIAAYGDLRLIDFGPGDAVRVTRVEASGETRARLAERLMLFFTDRTRDASTILADQQHNIPNRLADLHRLKAQAHAGAERLLAGDLDGFGASLDVAWQTKKALASGVTDQGIDTLYARARAAGALGGKITGAGGGGFLMLYAPPFAQDAVRAAMRPLRELPVRFEVDGSKVIFNIRR